MTVNPFQKDRIQSLVFYLTCSILRNEGRMTKNRSNNATRHHKKNLVIGITLSLALHLILISFVYEKNRSTTILKTINQVASTNGPIKILIQQTKPIKAVTQPILKPQTAPIELPPKPISQTQQSLTYNELLNLSEKNLESSFPETGSSDLNSDDHGNIKINRRGYAGAHGPKGKMVGAYVFGTISIPLLVRRDLQQGKSSALIENKNGKVKLIYLQGNPWLRAALFEALAAEINRKNIIDMFSVFESQRFRINLILEYNHVSFSFEEFKNRVQLQENKVELIVTRFSKFDTGAPQLSGIPIEDEHSRKAVARDRLHKRRLLASPAYRQTLENVHLFNI